MFLQTKFFTDIKCASKFPISRFKMSLFSYLFFSSSSSTCKQSEFISEDDVIKIREQATRSLAPVEKDFTSTVVIKNNETLLINESQFNRKRRSTRCQKRYNDDLFYDELNPDKPACLGLPHPFVSEKEKEAAAAKLKEAADLEKNRKVFVYEDTFKTIKNLSIVVPKFDFLNDIVPWCIYHNCYKCNCKNDMNLRSKRSMDQLSDEHANAGVTPKPGPKRRSSMKNDKPEKKFKDDDEDDIPLKDAFKEILKPPTKSVIIAKESVITAKGSVISPKGSGITAKESGITAKGSIITAKGSVTPSKESVTNHKESVTNHKENSSACLDLG